MRCGKGIFYSTMIIVFLIAVSSCGGRKAGNFRDIEDGKWSYGDEIVLACDSGGHNEEMAVALRYNDRYPYRTITLRVILTDKQGEETIDTLTIELNDENGKRLGHGMGGSYQIEKVSHLIFPTDSCTVTLSHVMKEATVEGIEMVGVLCNK